MSIKQSLIDEYNSQLEVISKMEVGTEAYKIAVDGLTKIADRIIELEKLESDSSIKWESMSLDNELKAIQIKEEKRDRIIKNCIEIGKIGGTSLLTWAAFKAAMNFEKNGYLFSTEGGRTALKSLLKFMK